PPPRRCPASFPTRRSSDLLERAANLFLTRFNKELYSLICNPDDPENPVIRGALESGTQNLGLVLGGVLVASFGWLPGIATVIARSEEHTSELQSRGHLVCR